jgi:hypothetical protein
MFSKSLAHHPSLLGCLMGMLESSSALGSTAIGFITGKMF